jgi:hypothetical protein
MTIDHNKIDPNSVTKGEMIIVSLVIVVVQS